MIYNLAICDDEALFAEKIKSIILEYNFKHDILCNVDIYNSYEDVNKLKRISDKYNIIFLDIDLENDTGFNVAKCVNENGADTYIVFVTESDSYAADGYKYNALRYIIKGSMRFSEQLYESLDVAYGKLYKKQHKRTVRFRENTISFSINELYYIESCKHILLYHINDEVYSLRNVLDNVENEYDSWFVRIHQSYLVNMGHIYDIKNLQIRMDNDKILYIAKSRVKEVREKYLLYKKQDKNR